MQALPMMLLIVLVARLAPVIFIEQGGRPALDRVVWFYEVCLRCMCVNWLNKRDRLMSNWRVVA